MTGPDQGLSSLIQGANKPSTFLATVSALNDDGTVSLQWGLGDSADPILGVAASKSYINRRATEYDDDGNITYPGDTVIVSRMNNSMIVIGTSNAQDIDFAALIEEATSDMQDDIDRLQAQVNSLSAKVATIYAEDIPSIYFGYANPSEPGWQKADNVYYLDQGSGRRDLYMQRLAETSTGTTKPAKPASSGATTPKTRTLTAVSKGSWRGGGGTDGSVKQADWNTGHSWSGAWFYNSTISSACSGKHVRAMKFTISRSKSAGGWNSGVNAHLRLITNSSKGNPNFTGSTKNVRLKPGQTVTFTLPASWASALASGSAKGIGMSGSGAGSYLTASSNGKLSIYFSAS